MLDMDSLQLSQDRESLLLTVRPHLLPVRESHIRSLFLRSPYSAMQLDENVLQEALAMFEQLHQNPGLGTQWGETFLCLARACHASVVVQLNDNKMAAWATITTARGGRHITHRDLVNAMQAAGVRYGLQKNRATELLELAKQKPPGCELKRVVALGRKALDGQDSRFERLVETVLERHRRPREIDNDRVDMRDLGQLSTVSEGSVLMRRRPHTLGLDGMNVLGEVLTHREGRELQFNLGAGVAISEEDENLLLATRHGLPLEIEHGMKVDDVLAIHNVDVAFGHVDYDGSVLILGDVSEGMRVSATGDVHVNGFVESASIEAGGDIVVGKGIIGRSREKDDEYTCKIRAEGSLSATFLQYAKADVGRDVYIFNQLSHGDVHARGNVTVKNPTGSRGALIGGHVVAGRQIEAVSFGASAGAATALSIAGDIDEIRAEHDILRHDQLELSNKIQKIAALYYKLESESDEAMRERVKQTMSHTQTQLQQVEQALERVQDREKAYFESAKICSTKALHAHVRMDIAGHTLLTLEDYGPSEAHVEQGDLVIGPLNQN